MLGTIISVLCVLGALLVPGMKESPFDLTILRIPMIIIAGIFLIVEGFAQSYVWNPLQRAEENLTPRVTELYRKDNRLRIAHAILGLFPLLTLVFLFASHQFSLIKPLYLLAGWTVLLGITTDAMHYIHQRSLQYLNPYAVVSMFTHSAKSSVQNEREMDLCSWIDSLAETGVKAVERDNPSLCNDCLGELQLIIRNFLEASKSISHHTSDSQSAKMGITDKISYTLFYLFQRIELINQKAVENNLEPVCSASVTTLGKIALHAAEFDISLSGYPIFFLGKCVKKAQQGEIADIGGKATITLLEVAKSIPEQVDITYLELKDTYLTLVDQLNEIAKESFREDKTTPISNLTQPFRTLQTVFAGPKLVQHQDTPVILAAIGQVLAEFAALEVIMKTIPPIPQIPEAPPPAAEPPPSAPPDAAKNI